MIRLSRLVWSPYENAADRSAEAALLSSMARLVGPDEDAEVLVTTSNRAVDAETLDARPSARLVITTTSGYDHLDLAALADRGVAACRLPEARRDAVVETAVSLILAGLHRHGTLRARAATGRWARAELPALAPRCIRGAPVGVIGLGVIGRRMAEVLTALGAEVWGSDPAGLPPGVRPASPREMVRNCRAVTLHCSLTPSSRDLVDGPLLEQASGPALVNTARGRVMDPLAALRALDAGRLCFLGVDVFPTEPWPGMAEVRRRPELVLLPHAAGYHDGLSALVRAGIAKAVEAFLAGEEPPHRLC
ncbi:MAG: hypothetical protein D6798_01515 [Deltaproteobacteria bacterium]|nr:MAG: hypothetical protein D6798_01515 [Deltaproteobacteria bacterium]